MDDHFGLDPEQVERDLAKFREPYHPPTDRELQLVVRMGSLMDEISDLEHSLLLPRPAEQERAILDRLEVLKPRLERVEADIRLEQARPKTQD
jgi:hypothetical protein